MPSRREFLPPGAERKPVEAVADLDYPATQAGTVGNISMNYATSFGASGEALAIAMIDLVGGPYNDLERSFDIAGGPVTVIIAPLSGNNDGTGGAYPLRMRLHLGRHALP